MDSLGRGRDFCKVWKWDVSELRCKGGKDSSQVDHRMKTRDCGRWGQGECCGWGWEWRQSRESLAGVRKRTENANRMEVKSGIKMI